MTAREQTLLKLLALGPASRADLVLATGWGIEATNATVDQLLARALVDFAPVSGNNGHQHAKQPLCLPQQRTQLLATHKRLHHERIRRARA
jgi:hypothetical protein